MKKLTTILYAALLAVCASAQVPFKWMVETSRPSLQKITVLRGETVALTPKLCSYNTPIDLTSQTVKLWFQTNGMGEVWWSANGTLGSTTGEVVVNFGPEQDVGASEYNFYVECKTPSGVRNYRAYGTLAMQYAPGFSPSVLASSAYPILLDEMLARLAADGTYATKTFVEQAVAGVQVELPPGIVTTNAAGELTLGGVARSTWPTYTLPATLLQEGRVGPFKLGPLSYSSNGKVAFGDADPTDNSAQFEASTMRCSFGMIVGATWYLADGIYNASGYGFQYHDGVDIKEAFAWTGPNVRVPNGSLTVAGTVTSAGIQVNGPINSRPSQANGPVWNMERFDGDPMFRWYESYDAPNGSWDISFQKNVSGVWSDCLYFHKYNGMIDAPSGLTVSGVQVRGITMDETNRWNQAATHTNRTDVHVTTADKNNWNGKVSAATLTAHTGDSVVHVTSGDKTLWNKLEAKQINAVGTDNPMFCRIDVANGLTNLVIYEVITTYTAHESWTYFVGRYYGTPITFYALDEGGYPYVDPVVNINTDLTVTSPTRLQSWKLESLNVGMETYTDQYGSTTYVRLTFSDDIAPNIHGQTGDSGGMILAADYDAGNQIGENSSQIFQLQQQGQFDTSVALISFSEIKNTWTTSVTVTNEVARFNGNAGLRDKVVGNVWLDVSNGVVSVHKTSIVDSVSPDYLEVTVNSVSDYTANTPPQASYLVPKWGDTYQDGWNFYFVEDYFGFGNNRFMISSPAGSAWVWEEGVAPTFPFEMVWRYGDGGGGTFTVSEHIIHTPIDETIFRISTEGLWAGPWVNGAQPKFSWDETGEVLYWTSANGTRYTVNLTAAP